MPPFSLLIKPSGSDCNIDCTYCFYKNRAPEIGQGQQRMNDTVLETLTRDYLQLGFPTNSFSWQGGEPMLMGLDFYQRAIAFQKRYAQGGQQISNALQTNGMRIDESWVPLFKEYQFLLGISCDGPRDIHDRYRRDRGGHGTWQHVMRGIKTCQAHGVEFNILVLVNRLSAEHPDAILDFFLERKIRWLQFIPCVELDCRQGDIADFSVSPEQYAVFLCRIFDRWLALGPAHLSIRDFDSMINYCLTGRHSICTFGRQCADYIVIEHTGDVYPCDFFVDPSQHLGNLLHTPIEQLATGGAKREFARKKMRLPNQCLICPYLDICRGGCMKDRIGSPDTTNTNTPRTSYFCASYKAFFAHALPKLRQVAARVQEERLI